MKAYDLEALADFTLAHLDRKGLRRVEKQLPKLVLSLARYDAHFMRLTGVLDAAGGWGEGEYDEDDAFEYVYDAYLSDNPDDADDDMAVATLLNRYMETKDDFFREQ